MLPAALSTAAAVQFDSIVSKRGVQHSSPESQPYLSDDFVIVCIMVLFLALFALGKQ